MKHFLYILFALAFTTSIFAQATANSNVTVTSSLRKGLSISLAAGNLTFGEVILTGVAQTPTITPGNGASFKVVGHPTKNITITFAAANLTNNAWVTTNGGTNSTLVFTPSVTQTGSNSGYVTPAAVTSGNVLPLVNVAGTGNMYVWVGGSLGVAANQAHGDYAGTFTLSVAY